ncbi:N-formylglutamate deformylase [uncultured Pelagimonas sp.]|uniref:N-formylglutamate deformylase n=1 Tax=uncultured Pelagimonas sp. TaxID=1618102 RepID=UPI002624C76F|nr:N-formylglutamate deformylase [uncultured Pelagimonas sp.]
MNSVSVIEGRSPIILGLPHTGTFVPPNVWADLNPIGRDLADTDWHVDQLYDGVIDGLTMVRANFHRYVIDANRDPSGASLYPGQNTTTLVPLTDFEGRDIWQSAPDADEIEARREAFHAPYHVAMQAQIERVLATHGVVILFDCHSIRGRIPFLFDGLLPDLNVGTDYGVTCDPRIEAAMWQDCENAPGYSAVLNGRFRGGWTVRHYSAPDQNCHTIQLELAQSTYLSAETPPWTYDPDKAGALREQLSQILQTLADLAPTLKGTS